MTLRQVLVQVPAACEAWKAVAWLVKDGIATLWVVDKGAERRLEDWEVFAVLRNRVNSSGEHAPADDALSIRAAEKIGEAYRRDFGAWFEQEFGG